MRVVNELLVGLLGAVLSTNPVLAASNLVQQTTGITMPVTDPKDPVEKEFRALLEADDQAQAEVDRWIQENERFAEQGAGASAATLTARIDQRFEPVIKGYEDFITKHPNHARARVAYGSFLNDIRREAEAMVQWERARQLNPSDPAVLNNLASYYSHRGPVRKAFEYLDRAIELRPGESLYYHNLATIVFLFRQDVREYYNLKDDQAVFRRALELYRKARKLDPENFALATDLAQTYYYLKAETEGNPEERKKAESRLQSEAISAWKDARQLAHDDLEREGTYIHMARLCIGYGRFDDARKHLEEVHHESYDVLKKRLYRNIEEKEHPVPVKEVPPPPASS